MKSMPQIKEFMSKVPMTVQPTATLKEIRELMHEHNVRHLPVSKDRKILGVVSDRALKSAWADEKKALLTAEDLMSSPPFLVSPSTPLNQVVAEMAEEKYGSVLVGDEGHLLGIFTMVDACRMLGQLLSDSMGGHQCSKHAHK